MREREGRDDAFTTRFANVSFVARTITWSSWANRSPL
jgi:hypothetical protein